MQDNKPGDASTRTEAEKIICHFGDNVFPQMVADVVDLFGEDAIVGCIHNGYLIDSQSKVGTSPTTMKRVFKAIELSSEGWRVFNAIRAADTPLSQTRKVAMGWWGTLADRERIKHCINYYHGRTIETLIGREIEAIYCTEHRTILRAPAAPSLPVEEEKAEFPDDWARRANFKLFPDARPLFHNYEKTEEYRRYHGQLCGMGMDPECARFKMFTIFTGGTQRAFAAAQFDALTTPSNSEREEEESRWISVEERLPVIGEKVMVCAPNRYTTVVDTGFLNAEEKWSIYYDDGEEVGYVGSEFITHWQPLPAPPSPR